MKRHVWHYLNKMFVDTALDRSIVLGYGRIGLLARERLPGWPADPPRIDGATVLVTGAASGIGLAAACGFARLGANVHTLTRDTCDLSNLAAVNAFAHEFAAREPRLDVLVNNAGVMPPERTYSVDGHELMFATHVLAPLALTMLLLPARVINVSSGGMYAKSLPEDDDWESERAPYSPKKLYASTKREEVVITEMLAERLRGRGVVVHAMHPGWVDTEGLKRAMPTFRTIAGPILRTADEGADTIVWLGAAPEPGRSTGLFWHDRRARPTHYRFGPGSDSAGDRERLWAYCETALRNAGIDPL